MMKKWIPLFLLCILLGACSTDKKNEQPVKKENNYCGEESGDAGCGLGSMDMSAYKGFGDKEHVFVKSDMEEAIRIFKEKESAVLYFGYPECPWCIEALPIMDESAKEHKRSIYYIQTRDEDKKLLYSDAQKKELLPYIEKFLETDDEGQKQLFVPFVMVVKDGVAISANTGTVSGHDAHERMMNDAEKQELKEIYDRMFA